ncbi:MAG: hypothetical protein KBF68_03225 [Nitrosomonas sp.]|nr:hypothetical protein [Nitrosomonas sp.]
MFVKMTNGVKVIERFSVHHLNLLLTLGDISRIARQCDSHITDALNWLPVIHCNWTGRKLQCGKLPLYLALFFVFNGHLGILERLAA